MGTDSDSAEMPSLSSLNYFNDEHGTHEDIIKVFEHAMRLLKRKIEAQKK